MVTWQYQPHRSFTRGSFSSFLLIFIIENQTQTAAAQIWRPIIELYIEGSGSEMSVYSGNKYPKFSVWPGKLYLNHSSIEVRMISLCKLHIYICTYIYNSCSSFIIQI